MILTVQKYSFLSVYANYFCQIAQLFSEYGQITSHRYSQCGKSLHLFTFYRHNFPVIFGEFQREDNEWIAYG